MIDRKLEECAKPVTMLGAGGGAFEQEPGRWSDGGDDMELETSSDEEGGEKAPSSEVSFEELRVLELQRRAHGKLMRKRALQHLTTKKAEWEERTAAQERKRWKKEWRNKALEKGREMCDGEMARQLVDAAYHQAKRNLCTAFLGQQARVGSQYRDTTGFLPRCHIAPVRLRTSGPLWQIPMIGAFASTPRLFYDPKAARKRTREEEVRAEEQEEATLDVTRKKIREKDEMAAEV